LYFPDKIFGTMTKTINRRWRTEHFRLSKFATKFITQNTEMTTRYL